MLNGKVILIVGGTGSFGQKFTQIVLRKYKPKKVIIFSRDELKQYKMQKQYNYPCMRYFIGDVRDEKRLHRAFHGVDIVVHAAALKQVPTAEYNPIEVIHTNILGSENIVNMAIDSKVKKVVALSTDKAVGPINLYGATKLCAEKLFVGGNFYSGADNTSFSVVRYGNVAGSRGSVIPFFLAEKEKGVLPVTDKKMTRFWITLEQGVNFVLRSIQIMKKGEIFVPKIPSMKITELAKAICPRCNIDEVGIRPGEKLHETLISVDEARYTSEYKDMFVVTPTFYSVAAKFVNIKTGEKGKAVKEGFSYTSDNNSRWLKIGEMQKIIEENKKDCEYTTKKNN